MTEPASPRPTNGRRPLDAAVIDLAHVLRRLVEQAKQLLEARRRHRSGSLLQPGVFVAEPDSEVSAASAQAVAAGWTVNRINGEGVTTKAAFLREMARALDFPDYFGHNWDALADCLGDLPAAPGSGRLLILDHFEQFATASPADWSVALTVLRRATEEWQDRNHTLLVLLHGPRSAAPDVPPLAPQPPA